MEIPTYTVGFNLLVGEDAKKRFESQICKCSCGGGKGATTIPGSMSESKAEWHTCKYHSGSAIGRPLVYRNQAQIDFWKKELAHMMQTKFYVGSIWLTEDDNYFKVLENNLEPFGALKLQKLQTASCQANDFDLLVCLDGGEYKVLKEDSKETVVWHYDLLNRAIQIPEK